MIHAVTAPFRGSFGLTILAVTGLLVITSSTLARGETMPGDLNGDGAVNSADVSIFCDHLLNGTYLEPADINQDGLVNLLDLAPFCQLVFGNSDCSICGIHDFCDSSKLIACNAPVIADNSEATNHITDPGFSCHFDGPGTQGQNTLWYRFVAAETSVLVTTCDTTDAQADDSLLAVYEGTCGNLTEIGCSEDDCSLLSSVSIHGLSIGQTYYIQLASYSLSDVGPYTLSVVCPSPFCAADIANADGPGPDGMIDVFDLLELLANWGTSGPGASISADGGGITIVDVFDLLEMLNTWGNSCVIY